MAGEYTLDDRMNDLCLLAHYIENAGINEGAIDVLCNEIQFIQTIQTLLEDMKNQVGTSEEHMDNKLAEWIAGLE